MVLIQDCTQKRRNYASQIVGTYRPLYSLSCCSVSCISYASIKQMNNHFQEIQGVMDPNFCKKKHQFNSLFCCRGGLMVLKVGQRSPFSTFTLTTHVYLHLSVNFSMSSGGQLLVNRLALNIG